MKPKSGAFLRLIVPGLVIQAVMVGGGYATGRELVEFFLSLGPLSGLVGMVVTATLFSITAMLSFELARRFSAFDYRSFCRIYLGRFWVLFELGYLAALLLSLSVVSAAAGELLNEVAGWPEVAGSLAFMAVVAGLLLFGSTWIERVISIWSIIFYATYGAMCLLVIDAFGGAMTGALTAHPVNLIEAAASGISYTGYNITVIPVMIFVARNLRSQREALLAGALTGPLVLLPGIAFLLTLIAFYPSILDAPLPISEVLRALDAPLLAILVQAVVLGALTKTGVGLLHGFNERMAQAAVEKGLTMPVALRPALALLAMLIAIYGASKIGLIDLVGRGYRYSAVYFLLVFLLPLFTRGLMIALKR